MRHRTLCCAGRGYAPMVQDAHSHRAMLNADRWIDRRVLRGLGVLTLIDGSTAAYRMHAQAPMLRPVLAAGRTRPIQPYLSVLLVGGYGRSMRIIDTSPSRPPSRHPALPVLEYRGNIMALQATTPQTDAAGVWSRAQVLRSCAEVGLLIPARACVCTHASTRGIKPFGTHGGAHARVRVERLTSRAISLRPLRALTAGARKGLACAGVWQV
jgi:hypothetical protein